MNNLLFLLVGIIVGGIACWMILKERIAGVEAATKAQVQSDFLVSQERLANQKQLNNSLQAQMDAGKQRNEQLVEIVQDEKVARATYEQACSEIPLLRETLDEKEALLTTFQAKQTELLTEASQLQTTLVEERKAAGEKLSLLRDARSNLSDAFKALSSEALKSNNQSFLDLAKTALETFQEAAKGDLDNDRRRLIRW